MSITINGSTGISGVDGDATTPAIRGADSDTGISFGTNEVKINTNGSSQVTVDSSGRVGLNSSLSGAAAYNRLVVNSPDNSCWFSLQSAQTGSGINTDGLEIGLNGSNQGHLWLRENADLLIATNGSERLRVLAAGGLTFNGDTAAANALDDYEQGTWTPSAYLSYNPSGRNVTTTNSLGRYIKIGNLAVCYFRFTYTLDGTGGFNLGINNLPFTAENNSLDFNGGGCAREDSYTGLMFFVESVIKNTNILTVLRRYDNGSPRDPTGNMVGSVSYMTA